MTPRHQTIATLFIVALTICAVGFGLLNSGGSIRERTIITILFPAGLALAATIAVTIAFPRLRKISGFKKLAAIAAVCSIALAILPLVFRIYRVRKTMAKLEGAYIELSKKGPPFPDSIDPLLAPANWLLWEHGYWVSPNRQSFEVFYRSSSDSYTLAYPVGCEGNWEWRGYNYRAPN
jgi:hypothetical protein